MRYPESERLTQRGDEALEIVHKYSDEVEDYFQVDPLETEFPSLHQQIGRNGIYLARADDNLAGAFKWRGAMVGAIELQKRGYDSLVVPSAGNHARGVILAAKALAMDIHVVIPKTAPPAKKEGLHELWDSPQLTVHAIGETFDDALDWAKENAHLGKLLHPYDNPHVIAGQGTLADDTLASLEKPQNVKHYVVSSGGFGGPAGALQRFHQLGRDDITVHAVEAEGSNSLSNSKRKNRVAAADAPNERYGGTAVRKIGEFGFTLFRRHKQSVNIVTANDEEVEAVIGDYESDRAVLERNDTPSYEPTTLLAVAALKNITKNHPEGDIVVVGSGHNAPLRQPLLRRVPTRVIGGTFYK